MRCPVRQRIGVRDQSSPGAEHDLASGGIDARVRALFEAHRHAPALLGGEGVEVDVKALEEHRVHTRDIEPVKRGMRGLWVLTAVTKRPVTVGVERVVVGDVLAPLEVVEDELLGGELEEATVEGRERLEFERKAGAGEASERGTELVQAPAKILRITMKKKRELVTVSVTVDDVQPLGHERLEGVEHRLMEGLVEGCLEAVVEGLTSEPGEATSVEASDEVDVGHGEGVSVGFVGSKASGERVHEVELLGGWKMRVGSWTS